MEQTQTHTHQGCHGGGHADHEKMVQDYRRRFWISLILTIPILLLSPTLFKLFGIQPLFAFQGQLTVLFVFATAIFFYGGWPFLKGGYEELKDRNPGMMTLIGLAIIVAYVYSSAIVFGLAGKLFFWELATLIDIMLLGHWIEMKSVMGAGKALEELAQLLPSKAHKVVDGEQTVDVSLEELVQGDLVLVKPGEKIPVDGTVLNGKSLVNEALLTGESKPVQKLNGDEVIGGAINGEGSLEVKVEKTGEDSFLNQVVKLVKEAQGSRSKTQDLANRAAFWLTIVAIGCGSATFLFWLFIGQHSLSFALERMVSVMVITCPHALGLAVPLVVAVSTSLSARHGLLIRDRKAFEAARNIKAVVFDKTGTLTEGRFGVTDVVLRQGGLSREELIRLAAGVESHSEHPIAKGITTEVERVPEVKNFNSITGVGVEGEVDGHRVKVVNGRNLTLPDELKLKGKGKTSVYVVVDDEVMGVIVLADVIRSESKDAIQALKKKDIQCMMLTGDQQDVADWVGAELGLDETFAQVKPDDKQKKIQEIQERGLTVAMVGDGVNDAPALAQADVGIAIGAGTDVAVEAADIVLVKNNPMDVVSVIGLADATYRKMVQNLIWATGYNAFAIPLAAGILYPWGIVLSPAVSAVLMSISTVVCAINAKLLRF